MNKEPNKALKELLKKLDDLCVGTQKALSEATAYLEEIQDDLYCIEDEEEESVRNGKSRYEELEKLKWPPSEIDNKEELIDLKEKKDLLEKRWTIIIKEL